jgi:hypothetical protein
LIPTFFSKLSRLLRFAAGSTFTALSLVVHTHFPPFIHTTRSPFQWNVSEENYVGFLNSNSSNNNNNNNNTSLHTDCLYFFLQDSKKVSIELRQCFQPLRADCTVLRLRRHSGW